MMAFLLRRVLLPWQREETRESETSLAALYERHVDYLYRCLRGFGLGHAAAEDAVHDVFVVAQRKLADFEHRDSRSTRNWLYGIAIRVARRQRSNVAREVPGSEDDFASTLRSDSPGPSRLVERNREIEALCSLLERLDSEKREAFVLAELEELSAPEIAEITGVKLNTVYSRIRLARRDLERLLAHSPGDDE